MTLSSNRRERETRSIIMGKKGQKKTTKLSKTDGESVNAKNTASLKSKSLDDFLQGWSDEGSENEKESNDDNNEGGAIENGSKQELGATKQKEYIANLKDKDPEFYKFLAENDESLLNFDESSEGEADDDDEELEKVHKHPDGNDDGVISSDNEEEDEETEDSNAVKTDKLSNATVEEWAERLEKTPNIKIISEVVLAFKAALANISLAKENAKSSSSKDSSGNSKKKASNLPKLKVQNGQVFNSLIKICITKLEPALGSLLKSKKKLSDNKNWKPLNKWLKSYTLDLVKLVSSITEPSMVSALLKHIHGMVPYYAALPKSAKNLIKTLINLWSTHSEDSVRVLAFMAILRLSRSVMSGDLKMLLESTMKQMYMAYIRNAKFTSPNTWPMIHFMRRSMAEIFLLDPALAYRHGFIYIRQLTIHLRNAMMNVTQKKKETPLQTVYNWQFAHSIHLWVQMIGDSTNDALDPLVYPLVQLINGTIRLNYTSKYFPLRFHLSRLLIQLSEQTGKFIPILPYYLDILNTFNVGKKAPKQSMKPMDFSCVLRLSKSQLVENSFKDATIENVYGGLLETLASLSHKISFPEIAVPALAQIKTFLKKCRIAKYSKKLKAVLDQIQENSKFVQDKRSKVTFGVKDLDQIGTFETQLKAEGTTPLQKYYETFKSIKAKEKLTQAHEESSKKDDNEDDANGEDYDVEMENEDEDEKQEEIVPPQKKSGKKRRKENVEEKPAKKKKKKKMENSALEENNDDGAEEDDIVEDFNDFSDDE